MGTKDRAVLNRSHPIWRKSRSRCLEAENRLPQRLGSDSSQSRHMNHSSQRSSPPMASHRSRSNPRLSGRRLVGMSLQTPRPQRRSSARSRPQRGPLPLHRASQWREDDRSSPQRSSLCALWVCNQGDFPDRLGRRRRTGCHYRSSSRRQAGRRDSCPSTWPRRARDRRQSRPGDRVLHQEPSSRYHSPSGLSSGPAASDVC